MSAYFDALLRYFDMGGRATRSQYWLYYLISTLIILAAILCDIYVLRVRPTADFSTVMPLTLAVSLFHIVPGITVTVRRLHDVGRSGWWYFIQVVPFGGLLLFWWTVCPSEEGENEYGTEPAYGYREREEAVYARRPRSTDYVRQTLDRLEARRPSDARFL